MTVKELKEILDKFIDMWHGDLSVIADCQFTMRGEYYSGLYLPKIKQVAYQSGEIAIIFSDEDEDEW